MANALFYGKSYAMNMPEPLTALNEMPRRSDSFKSSYAPGDAQATLHSPTLCAILTYMTIDDSVAAKPCPKRDKSAIGFRLIERTRTVAEYRSITDKTIHLVSYDHRRGEFAGGWLAQPEATPEPYVIGEKSRNGAACLFAMMPYAIADEEFCDLYLKLADEIYNGCRDMDAVSSLAYILCDNIFRRIEAADALGLKGLKTNFHGGIHVVTRTALDSGDYDVSEVLYGDLKCVKHDPTIMAAKSVTPFKKAPKSVSKRFPGMFQRSERQWTAEEEIYKPQLQDWYELPNWVVTLCSLIKATSSSAAPMRNIMLRGPSSAGKTSACRAIAAGLGIPYIGVNCAPDYDRLSLLGEFLPFERQAVDVGKLIELLPKLVEIDMDPENTYQKLTGRSKPGVKPDEVYLEVIRKAVTQAPSGGGGPDVRYVMSELVKAFDGGWLCELQECSIISNQGVLVSLNSMLDDCASVNLPNHQRLERHPDNIVVLTTNVKYVGCRTMNQSIISRMDYIVDLEAPEAATIARWASLKTGVSDLTQLTAMAEVVLRIEQYCEQNHILDGSCGPRELVMWAQANSQLKNLVAAAENTLLASATLEEENRAPMREMVRARFEGSAAA